MNNMVTEWSEISKNTIEALKIMGMGMLAIFIVILIITIAVYLLNLADKKVGERKKARETAIASNETPSVAASTPNAIATSTPAPTQVSTPTEVKVEERSTIKLSELGDNRYRKGADPKPNRYRKRDEDKEESED